jgi:hypothetical protein
MDGIQIGCRGWNSRLETQNKVCWNQGPTQILELTLYSLLSLPLGDNCYSHFGIASGPPNTDTIC